MRSCLQGGTDVGDHPPITPVVMATEADLDTDSWRIYDYVARHFLGSVSPDCVYRRMKASFSCAGETFSATGMIPVRPGFTAVMPWRVSLTVIWIGLVPVDVTSYPKTPLLVKYHCCNLEKIWTHAGVHCLISYMTSADLPVACQAHKM